MAKITYTYKSFPNCQRATEYSHRREHGTACLGGILGMWSLCVVMLLFIGTFSFFEDANWNDLIAAILISTLTAYANVYVFVIRSLNTECKLNIILREEAFGDKRACKEEIKILKKENLKDVLNILKKFSLYYFLCLFITISLVGIIKGYIWVSEGYGTTPTLVFSMISFILFSLIFFLTLPIGKKIIKKWFK